ncbi:hypothetical protein CTM86_08475 [Fusobacterium pseudoperiodonticum]|uniref:Stress response protein NST1 n=1 Tax=Fusobacterium pseudoperiodonticum TaxID=2663009 RepID=A0AAD0AVC9_9FUSO|nr:FAD-I family protein [Fusobacterium pseudoperiodonticum]ATV57334.1 hypothetical protein CTM68_06420 [Fusobacterium pseudoperiodonticum]ATV66621.1 hypothetical protein CTM86_08475 [Fusobacterium pseudoperiodonticum]
MKNKLILTALLGLLLVGSFSYAEESDDEAKKRLLKEYEKVQKEREKEAEEAAKRQAEEGTQSVQDIANQATENGEVVEGVAVEGGEVAVAQEEVAPKKARKDMTESEKMDLEVQRIKKRMLEINDKIENYNKTNEMLDNLEKNVGELEKRVRY